MRRLIALVFGLVVALASSVTSASAETFDNPQGNFNWKVYDYNASGQALRVRQPFLVQQAGDGGIAFNFLYTPDTALFMTGHPSYRGDLLGDMTGKTITARIGITVTSDTTPIYTYYGEGTPSNPCGEPANVRFYFQTKTNGPFNPSDYWWSNPVHSLLQDLNNTTVEMANSFEPGLWTNYNGQPDPAGFAIAARNVVAIGLSFGGGCFFENGVGIVPGTGSSYFRLMDYSSSSESSVDPLASVVPELVLAPFVTPTLIWLP